MDSKETPGGTLTPEEAEGIVPGATLQSEREVLAEAEDKAQAELHDQVSYELAELNRLAAKELGIEAPEGETEDTLNLKTNVEASNDVDAMMPNAELNTRIGRNERTDENPQLGIERKAAMQHEINEGMVRYREAFTDATNLLILRPRSETVKERWVALAMENNRDLTAIADLVQRGEFMDPGEIRATFDTAGNRLRKFAEDADRS